MAGPTKVKKSFRAFQHHLSNQTATASRNSVEEASTGKGFEQADFEDFDNQRPRHDNDYANIAFIKILPTTDEILSARRPWLPLKDSRFGGKENRATGAYLDIHFRHLRHESVAPIIDSCLAGLRIAVREKAEFISWQQRSPKGERYNFFQNVAVESAMMHTTDGAMFQLTYDCPAAYRGAHKMGNAPFFQEGMLCALLVVYRQLREVDVIFLQVKHRQSTEAMLRRTGSLAKAAIQVTLAEPEDNAKVSSLVSLLRGQSNPALYMVDMPSILVASFHSHLGALQQISLHGDLAFKDYITAKDPTATVQSSCGTSLNVPANLSNGKFLNLNKLRKIDCKEQDLGIVVAPLNAFLDMNKSLSDIKNRSILDDGQAVALLESFSRELAFTQGPPGTGKTFLGVALVETLLNSRNTKESQLPIVVICQTNHALDDFIAELINRGITKISRLGGGSNAKWIDKYLLRSQRKKQRAHRYGTKILAAKHRLEALLGLGSEYAQALSQNNTIPWLLIKGFLQGHHPQFFEHFESLDGIATQHAALDLRAAKLRSGFSFTYWQEGSDIKDVNGLIKAFETMLGETAAGAKISESYAAALKDEVARSYHEHVNLVTASKESANLWSLNTNARQKLASQWLYETGIEQICEGFEDIHLRFHRERADLLRLLEDFDVLTMQDQAIEVIAMTSTASAKMRTLLTKLRPSTIIFEEASELIEAHTTVALVPSVKHCIQIGDPLQLRPHVNQRDLSTENSPRYRLDESLFERFMSSGMPFSRLNTQRRAHPEIADLLRVGDYPYLLDHPSTRQRAQVAGMASRMWWIDHQRPEDEVDPLSPFAKSSSNQYEVKYVSAFIQYLVEKQGYKFREISVITPYKAQLAALQTELTAICPVALTEKDVDEMIEARLIEDKEYAIGTILPVSLGDMLRIATVDNYQGEQARVIIFTAVRSNAQGKIGFLANRNRTNVAISRAEDGFYVIGNAELIAGDEHWAKIIDVFRTKGLLGTTITAQCPRHPKQQTSIRTPLDFKRAYCSETCLQVLSCGHICQELCHSPEMHEDGRVQCKMPCEKVRSCGHICQKSCSEPCGLCPVITNVVKLGCGHGVDQRCGEKAEDVICTEVVDHKELACGHVRTILCSQTHEHDRLTCVEKCGKQLPCGHTCQKLCSECLKKDVHPQTCEQRCGRELACGHFCQSVCHTNPCPQCTSQCEKECQHGNCEHPCGEPCKPCTRVCKVLECRHQVDPSAETLCCLLNALIPCSQPCDRTLSCGLHKCPSLCGERCPDTCEECETGQGPATHRTVLHCNHTFSVTELDRIFGMEDVFEYDEANKIVQARVKKICKPDQLLCPKCGSSTANTARYRLPNALSTLKSNVDELTRVCARIISWAFMDVSMGDQILFLKFDSLMLQLKPGPMSAGVNRRTIDQRCSRLIDAQQDAMQREHSIARFENAVRLTCEKLHSELFPIARATFALRCKVLSFWSRLAVCEFAYRVTAKFSTISDPDLGSRIMLRGLTSHVIEQSAGQCQELDAAIAVCQERCLPRLEVEFRMIQLCFWSVLRSQSAEYRFAMNVGASQRSLYELMARFPRSAGLFERGVRKLCACMNSHDLVPRFSQLNSTETCDVWIRLGKCRGPMTLCPNRHVFAPALFEECPECGPEVAPAEAPTKVPQLESGHTKDAIVDVTALSTTLEEMCGGNFEHFLQHRRYGQQPSDPGATESKDASLEMAPLSTSPDDLCRTGVVGTETPTKAPASESPHAQDSVVEVAALSTTLDEMCGASFEHFLQRRRYGQRPPASDAASR